MAIKDLIKAGRKELGWTEQRFGDAIGVSRGAVQQWEKGTTAPARKHQEAVAKLIGITLGELMTGKAAKYPGKEEKTSGVGESPASYTADDFGEFRRLLEQMNTAGRSEALEYMRYLAKRHPSTFSGEAADGSGDTIPHRSKAA